ncbi:MAG: PQQ-dependent sugar dehydrogenase, partial [Candidatus Uhrbacteria bacterium]|nr:PQQ-dependent sugar dehydrogenase [Candidatus Uhrbacteria bacterium]
MNKFFVLSMARGGWGIIPCIIALSIFFLPSVTESKSFFTLSTRDVKGFVVEDEQSNHAWYVNPMSRERFFIGTTSDLSTVVKINMVGISEMNFSRLIRNPIFAGKYKGVLFIRVEHRGEVWYVDPGTDVPKYLGSIDSFSMIQKIAKLIPQEVIKPIRVSGKSPSWLIVPDAYRARIVSSGFTRPRVLAFDQGGNLFVSDFAEKGKISVLFDSNEDGVLDSKKVIVPNLYNPHGIAFADNKLYVAAEYAVYSWFYSDKKRSVISPPTKVMALPAGGEKFAGQGHKTRTIVNGGDGYVYLSVGSNCDQCAESDAVYASIQRINIKTGSHATYARGLRNTVFFDKDPLTGFLWGNDMGQDNLGRDIPPDELNKLTVGDYGWPYCYGEQMSAPNMK